MTLTCIARLKARGEWAALIAALALCLAVPALAAFQPVTLAGKEGVRYSESVLPWDGGLLISNFGSEGMGPREDEDKGYILYYKDGETRTVVPADGRLHMPTGMAVKDGRLFVCNCTRNELAVYNMNDLKEAPRSIPFGPDDAAVNAMALAGDHLYVTVTNTGRIYRIDVSDAADPGRPEVWLENVPGPNGLTVAGDVMYLATIPADYANVTPENAIYRVPDIRAARPTLEKFYDVPGLYDGAAASPDGRTLYVSDWTTASVLAIDTETRQARTVWHEGGAGPADIAVGNGTLYIPDLPGSRVILLPLE